MYRHNLAVLAKHGVRIAIGSDQFRGTSMPEALDIDEGRAHGSAALLRALTSGCRGTIFPKRAPYGLTEGAPADFLVFDGTRWPTSRPSSACAAGQGRRGIEATIGLHVGTSMAIMQPGGCV